MLVGDNLKKYMYIVYYEFSVEDGFDWEPVIKRQDELCEEYKIKRMGSGIPLGVFSGMVEVFKTDVSPDGFVEFIQKNMDWEGKIRRLRGCSNGLSEGVVRTDTTRNGQVPIVAATAWQILTEAMQ